MALLDRELQVDQVDTEAPDRHKFPDWLLELTPEGLRGENAPEPLTPAEPAELPEMFAEQNEAPDPREDWVESGRNEHPADSFLQDNLQFLQDNPFWTLSLADSKQGSNIVLSGISDVEQAIRHYADYIEAETGSANVDLQYYRNPDSEETEFIFYAPTNDGEKEYLAEYSILKLLPADEAEVMIAVDEEKRKQEASIRRLKKIEENPIEKTRQRIRLLYREKIQAAENEVVPTDKEKLDAWINKIQEVHEELQSLLDDNLDHPDDNTIPNIFGIPKAHILAYIEKEKDFQVVLSVNSKEKAAAVSELQTLVSKTCERQRSRLTEQALTNLTFSEKDLEDFYTKFPEVFKGESILRGRRMGVFPKEITVHFDLTDTLKDGILAVAGELLSSEDTAEEMLARLDAVESSSEDWFEPSATEEERETLYSLFKEVYETFESVQDYFQYGFGSASGFNKDAISQFFRAEVSSYSFFRSTTLYESKRSQLIHALQTELAIETRKGAKANKTQKLLQRALESLSEENRVKNYELVNKTIEDDVKGEVTDDEIEEVLTINEDTAVDAPPIDDIYESILLLREGRVRETSQLVRSIQKALSDVKIPDELKARDNEHFFPILFLRMVIDTLKRKLSEGDFNLVEVDKKMDDFLNRLDIETGPHESNEETEAIKALRTQINYLVTPEPVR